MDIKPKLEKVKKKIKDNAPYIIGAVAGAYAGALYVRNRKLKSLADEYHKLLTEPNSVHIGEAATEHLRNGGVGHLTNDLEDFCIIMERHNHDED